MPTVPTAGTREAFSADQKRSVCRQRGGMPVTPGFAEDLAALL
jgi:hypothetical protein